MSDIPFHVAGGVFATKRPAAPAFDASFLTLPKPQPPEAPTSRRRRLWEVSHKFHCPIIGSCFEVRELRGLMHKVMHLPPDTSDFVLHTTAVGACEDRSRLAELLHKTLEKRYALTIRRFAAGKTTESVRERWREAVATSMDLPGALWAAWTHPACDALLENEIYGDIHMIQHQLGTGSRADLKTLQEQRAENAELRRQIDSLRQDAESARHEKACETRALAERLTELRVEQAGRDACIARLSAELAKLRDSVPELRQRQALARRAEDAEARATALAAQCREQADSLERMRRRLEELESQRPKALGQPGEPSLPGEAMPGLAVESLEGKSVLCVGGRSGTIDAYREAVERQGGRFLHHDGGLEESLHRIDGALAAADLVICQAGCISHNAYWRVKEQCKRTGKPCLFLKRSSISSFGRVIADLCGDDVAATTSA